MRTPEENRILAGKEFNAILRDDPVLRELERRKYDRAAETRLLLATLGLGRWSIGSLPVLPLTAEKWCFLWILDNGFALDRNPVTPEDVDSFLYILAQPDLRKLDLPLHAIPGASSGFGAATGLPPAEVLGEIREVIRDAFRPLELIPPEGKAEDEAHYDTLWLTRICGIAGRESGVHAEEVCREMPLSTVCAYYVNWLIENSDDPKKYQRMPDRKTIAAMDARIDELAENFLHRK